jgi:hypothetical protein
MLGIGYEIAEVAFERALYTVYAVASSEKAPRNRKRSI